MYYITVYLCIHLYIYILYIYILIYNIFNINCYVFRRPAGSLRPSLQTHIQAEPQAALHPHERQAEGQALCTTRDYPEHQEKGHGALDQQLLEDHPHLHVDRPLHNVHQDCSRRSWSVVFSQYKF